MDGRSTGIMVPRFARGLHALLVDHDETNLIYMASSLQEFYKVTTTELPSMALSMILEGVSKYDFVIAEVNMLEMSGFDFLHQIHQLVGDNMPVILMSSNGNMSIANRALGEGACHFFQKPIRKQDLINSWQHVFNKRMNRKSSNQVGLSIQNSPSANNNIVVDANGKDVACRLLTHPSSSFSGIPTIPNVQNHNIEQSKLDKASYLVEAHDAQENRKISNLEEELAINKDENIEYGKRKRDEEYGTGHPKTTDDQEKGKEISVTDEDALDKRQRVTWTPELHASFIEAVTRLGESRAHPSAVMKVMNVPYLTYRHVASHLQVPTHAQDSSNNSKKHRQRVKKVKDEYFNEPPTFQAMMSRQAAKLRARLGFKKFLDGCLGGVGSSASMTHKSQPQSIAVSSALITDNFQPQSSAGSSALIIDNFQPQPNAGSSPLISDNSQPRPNVGSSASITYNCQPQPSFGSSALMAHYSQPQPSVWSSALMAHYSQPQPSFGGSSLMANYSQSRPSVGSSALMADHSYPQPSFRSSALMADHSQPQPSIGSSGYYHIDTYKKLLQIPSSQKVNYHENSQANETEEEFAKLLSLIEEPKIAPSSISQKASKKGKEKVCVEITDDGGYVAPEPFDPTKAHDLDYLIEYLMKENNSQDLQEKSDFSSDFSLSSEGFGSGTDSIMGQGESSESWKNFIEDFKNGSIEQSSMEVFTGASSPSSLPEVEPVPSPTDMMNLTEPDNDNSNARQAVPLPPIGEHGLFEWY